MYKSVLFWGLVLIYTFASAQVDFVEHNVDSFDGASDIVAFDIDEDGDVDIFATAVDANELSWWENDGDSNFTKHVIVSNLGDARSVRVSDRYGNALDFNSDGHNDIVACGISNNEVYWFAGDGFGGFTSHIVDDNFGGAHTLDAGDIDGDGDMDITCGGTAWGAGGQSGGVAWWENDGAGSFAKHEVYSQFNYATFVAAVDMNGDSNLDLLAAGYGSGKVIWLENDGQEQFTVRMIENFFPGGHTVIPQDLDQDGDMDVLGAAFDSDLFMWWENDGSEHFTQRLLSSELNGPIWADAADFDLDGDLDILGSVELAGDIVWWPNTGNQFSEHITIENSLNRVYCAIPADLDLDGDIDVLAAGKVADRIVWYENTLMGNEIQDKSALNNTSSILTCIPNPFNPITSITFSLNNHSMINLSIFNAKGQLVNALINQEMQPGNHSILWKGEDSSGNAVSSGMYFCRLSVDNNVISEKIVLSK